MHIVLFLKKAKSRRFFTYCNLLPVPRIMCLGTVLLLLILSIFYLRFNKENQEHLIKFSLIFGTVYGTGSFGANTAFLLRILAFLLFLNNLWYSA
jgi:hypothetical protein